MIAHGIVRSIRGDRLAFALTVAAALLPALVKDPALTTSPRGWAALACGFVFVAAGCLDHPGLATSGARRRLALYFAGQALLLAAIFALTGLRGMSVLAAFPLAGQAVFLLPAAWAFPYVAALYASTLAGAIRAGASDAPMAAATLFAGFAFVVVFTRLARREKQTRIDAERLSAELAEANTRLRAQAEHIEALASARERNRVAREIHDSLGHSLTTLAVRLEAASALRSVDPDRAWDSVSKARALAGDALRDVRLSVGALREENDPPLPELLRRLAAEPGPPAINFSLLGEARALAPDIAHGLLRAAQEGLTNARKHAAAKTVSLILDYRTDGRVSLDVEDDGRGCVALGAGYGLVGLRERAALLDGRFTAAGRATGGFALRLEVPG